MTKPKKKKPKDPHPGAVLLGKLRAASMTEGRRKAIAKQGAAAKWAKYYALHPEKRKG